MEEKNVPLKYFGISVKFGGVSCFFRINQEFLKLIFLTTLGTDFKFTCALPLLTHKVPTNSIVPLTFLSIWKKNYPENSQSGIYHCLKSV